MSWVILFMRLESFFVVVATQRYQMGAQVSSFFSSLSNMDWSATFYQRSVEFLT